MKILILSQLLVFHLSYQCRVSVKTINTQSQEWHHENGMLEK